MNLAFPDIEKIKSLPKDEEYEFKLFDITDEVYCRIVYNEDYNEGFFLEITHTGYSDSLEYSEYFEVEEYEVLKIMADMLYDKIFINITQSNEECSGVWFTEGW